MDSKLEQHMELILREQEKYGHGDISVHGHILKMGRLFDSRSLTSEEQAYIDLCNWREHRKKDCYYNAQMTAMSMPPRTGVRLLYAEGFVNTGNGVAIHHAWISLNGKVVDTTLRTGEKDDLERVMGIVPVGWEYYGVELDPEECLHSLDHGTAVPLTDDWQCGWPLLTREKKA